MAKRASYSPDGIYVGYFTGTAGTSLGIFLFKDGIISGADIGRMSYEGEYTVSEDRTHLIGSVTYTMPPGETSITGAPIADEPANFTVPIKLPVDFSAQPYHRIETPLGPVNARFEKIRDV